MNLLVQAGQERHDISSLPVERTDQPGQAWATARQCQIGPELLTQLRVVVEGVVRRRRLDQEIKRVDRLEFGEQFQIESQPGQRLRQIQPRQIVLERVANPIDEVRLGIDIERLATDPMLHGRRRPQAQPMRGQFDRARKTLRDAMPQGDTHAHGVILRRRSRVQG